MTVQCDQIPPVPLMDASDSCGPISVHFDSFNVSGSCANNFTIYRRWIVRDCSGNSLTHIQAIQVIDTVAPVLSFSSPLSNMNNVSCHNVPPPPAVCGSDNCAGLDVYFREIRRNFSSNPLCARYQLNRTWSLVDACGLMTSASQLVSVWDNTPPSCPPPPAPRLFSCRNVSLALPQQPSCIDDCSSVIYTPFESTVTGFCPSSFTKIFAWRVSDQCGNFVWWNQSFVITDTEAPIFVQIPAHGEFPCNAIPPMIPPQVVDACSTVNVSFREFNNSHPNACQNFTITRIWTAIDACGNANSATQLLHIFQNQAPVWTTPLPGNMTMECSSNVSLPILNASSPCGPVQVSMHVTTLSETSCLRVQRVDWVASNLCGLSLSHSIFITITDTIKPVMITGPDFRPFVIENCNSSSLPPSVCCSDNCNGLRVNFNETMIAGSCPSRFMLLRRWECVDQCGNIASLEQTVNVVDNTPPVFLPPLPISQSFECTMPTAISLPPVVQAMDTCGSVTVNMSEFRINGSCSANFILIRRFVATDQCGLQSSFNQTVTVHQTTPPFTNQSIPLCFTSETMNNFLVIRNLTMPNNFFTAGDLCTPIRLIFQSCTSDQDSILGSGCIYNSSTDTLYVSPRTESNHMEGRLYTVQALIMNECGLSTPTMRQIFVPFNRSSIALRGFTFSPEECVPLRPSCPQGCACQTVNHYCMEGAASNNTSLQLMNISVDSSADTTTFTYRLVSLFSSSSSRPDRVLLGVDLTRYQLVSVNPDVNISLGPQVGSYIKGIAWNNAAANPTDIYAITIQGALSAAQVGNQNIPYLLGGGAMAQQDSLPTPCSTLRSLTGPARSLAPTFLSSSFNLVGKVHIVGARFGIDRSADIAVHDVVVALINRRNGRILGMRLTDLDGSYVFHDISRMASNTAADLGLMILQDGILRPALRSSGNFLRSDQFDVFGENAITGMMHNLSSPIFNLLLDDQQQPIFNRALNFNNNFEGNAKPLSWWRFQLSGNGELDDTLSQAQISTWQAQAHTLLRCSPSLASNDPLEAHLQAAALNYVSGRGFFEPYQSLQLWYIRFAEHIFCDHVSSASDQALALRFMQMINMADDIDKSL